MSRAGVAAWLGAAVAAVAGVVSWIALSEPPASPPGAESRVRAAEERGRRPRLRARTRADAESEAAAGLAGLADAAKKLAQDAALLPTTDAGRLLIDGRRAFGDGRNGPSWEVDAAGRVVRRGAFVDGKRDGLWVETDPSGGRSETEYRRGLKHGREAAWRGDGTPRFLGQYEDGEMAGTWTTWHEGGVLHMTREYTAGVLHGTVREFHRSGALVRESLYSGGKDAGPTTTWHDDGALECVMPHLEGKREGDAVWYHRNGRVAARATYVADKLQGPYRSWDEDGTERAAEEWKDGVRVGGPKLRASAALGGEPPRTNEPEGR